MKYQLIASGTFDLLHDGHKSFLKKSLEIADEVIVCITSDLYVQSFKNGKDIEDFEIRCQAVLQFLESVGAKDKTKIISIDDIYGPLLTNQYKPKGIAVTPENEKTGELINSERAKKGLSQLEIKVIEMDLAEDGGVISSTRIRNGEINREGRFYINPVWKNKSLVLPESFRSELQEPFGEIIENIPSGLTGNKIVTIGDVTTKNFNQQNIGQFLSIVDFQVQRHKEFEKLSDLGFDIEKEVIKADNPAGTIAPSLFDEIKKVFSSTSRKVILVNGEEDLAVLPALLVSPLGFTIFYGQPNMGLVKIDVTEGRKEKAFELISKFELS